MVNAGNMIRAACTYLGTPYEKLDCQAFVEQALKDAGLRLNLAGSNAWIREVMKSGWVGSPEDCRKKYGKIPEGAFLFIVEQDNKEPPQYRGDGIGNASHIGIYTGLTGEEMVALSGNPGASKYNYGNGAIHSSYTRGCVATSRFSGKTIKDGWNRVGIWNRINYNGGDAMQTEYKAKVVGGGLNVRAEPSKDSARIAQLPNGSIVTVIGTVGSWCEITCDDITGYVLSGYLREVQTQTEDDGMITIKKSDLEEIYDKLGKILKG